MLTRLGCGLVKYQFDMYSVYVPLAFFWIH